MNLPSLRKTVKRIAFIHQTAAIALLSATLNAQDAAPADKGAANSSKVTPTLMYIPPAWENRVVFYQNFEDGVNTSPLNRGGLQIGGSDDEGADGFTGRGFRCPDGHNSKNQEAKRLFELRGPALGIHRAITVMLWWRLDKPMTLNTGFGLITMSGKGRLMNFVQSAGEWCDLKRPTYVSQINFDGIAAQNNIWNPMVPWFESGAWHHTAMTVVNASVVSFYWDGKLVETIRAKGRLWNADDVHIAQLGSYRSHPMTIDDVMVVDRALTGPEIDQYVRSCQALSSMGVASQEMAGAPTNKR